ncbi:MFS transporter [Streptacidiphilus sp. MAP5-3]|uniref:MFS transporter n=1 Tax=unclassified Streptacidiphilus TaxID=2643834 RepID=UPI003511FC96
MDPLTAGDPTVIGPYRLIARLGNGGMGLVYLGRHSDNGRAVAVKVVKTEYARHPEFRRRFAREVAAARRVDGSWTAAVLDADVADSTEVPWVATQHIAGLDLHTIVSDQHGALPEDTVLVLANRLALALQAVHEAGLIHRDLKPSNVVVTVDGPRVIDFGIARALDSLTGTADSRLTGTGMLIGSPGFMSPEQVRGKELTFASDVFCLGAVLVYAATGRLLFGAGESGLQAHIFSVWEDEPDLTGVPDTLVDLVRACLHKTPSERPTLTELAERTSTNHPEAWLPTAVLTQLARHASALLDYTPEPRTGPPPTPKAPPAYTPTTPVSPEQVPVQAQEFSSAPTAPASVLQPPLPPRREEQEASPQREPRASRRWRGLVVAVLAQLLVAVQAGAFIEETPWVLRDLRDLRRLDTVRHRSLLDLTYTVAFVGLLILARHAVDRLGRRLTLVAGLFGFAAASLLAVLAGDFPLIVSARALQGFAAALVTVSTLSVTAGFTEPRARNRAYGVYAVTLGAGPALGLLVGGWFVELLNWRVAMFVVALIATVIAVSALSLLDKDAKHGKGGNVGQENQNTGTARTGAPARFDFVSAELGLGGLLALAYGLFQGATGGDEATRALVAIGACLFVAFLWRRTSAAIDADDARPGLAPKDRPRRLPRRHDLFGATFVLLLAGTGLVVLLASLTYFLQVFQLQWPLRAGAALLPLVVALLVGSVQVSTRLLGRVAPVVLLTCGLVTLALGLWLLTRLTVAAAYTTQVLPALLLTGFGVGLAFMPLLVTATAGLTPHRVGAAASTVATALQLGAAGGYALFTPWFLFPNDHKLEGMIGVVDQLVQQCTTSLWWGFGCIALACLVALSTIRVRPAAPE